MNQKMRNSLIGTAIVLIMMAGLWMPVTAQESTPEATAEHCEPTRQQGRTSPLDPSPVRSSVGVGFILQGTVVSEDCSPVSGATVLFWLANEQGEYDEAHRGTIVTDENGRYKFESNFPGEYAGASPHIHVFVWAKGHKDVETAYSPKEGQDAGILDIVLAVQEKESCTPTISRGQISEEMQTAPLRDKVGEGHILSGSVMSTDCWPIVGAKVVLWLANEAGQYDDDHRAIIVTDVRGQYTFESNYPGMYDGAKPHIHIYVSVTDYQNVVTEYFPTKSATRGTFDIVLMPEKK
jgi:protocatechuate 3,4-dioxygenase beta subunit